KRYLAPREHVSGTDLRVRLAIGTLGQGAHPAHAAGVLATDLPKVVILAAALAGATHLWFVPSHRAALGRGPDSISADDKDIFNGRKCAIALEDRDDLTGGRQTPVIVSPQIQGRA